ncbi:MAG TPA: tRNA uridine(34) 5-carboxymethylaminomethyl modification radical SAM/GNAT enzyme Elp3 [Thermoplasmataceae archaeon]|nr:tRNA uridine(34) 5-carboxymethylaminomethyl modification radical SAM/GNAT enzyme Elp3 [Thermoplasmatales archaeon AK]HLH85350.1 tRNA uridine(34) 5-carboxymethylaminomethyl modification radical SAM/GNAT enzyme Elp3 [Thermoplasmataceae archaeon]
MEFYETIGKLINSGAIRNKESLQKEKIRLSRQMNLDRIPSDVEILRSGFVGKDHEKLLRLKPTRTISGVAVVAAMTSPEDCPHGRCLYCPGGVSYNSPQAYTGYEPAALRGRMNNYDPYLITFNRLKQLENIGHDTSKVDLIIMGGTFTARTPEYQRWFVKGCLDGMNGTVSETLEEAISLNENSHRRCVGLTVETKPDWFYQPQIDLALSYGTTKVELGAQVLDEKVLRINGRGHGVKEIIDSTKLAKDAGLKIVYHIMPGMYGSDRETDIESFRKLVGDPEFKPDMLKIYPTLVVKGTALYKLWKAGHYIPLDTVDASDLITEFLKITPPWIRIQRMQRDIPVNFIEAGVKRSDIRNIVEKNLKHAGADVWEIRQREVGFSEQIHKEPALIRREYEASGGEEIFLSYESDREILGFLRLRILSGKVARPELDAGAVVREIKVLGQVVPIGARPEDQWQHRGLGRKLMAEAERIASESYGRGGIAVISGIGVRNYFRQLGYERAGPYMVKNFSR